MEETHFKSRTPRKVPLLSKKNIKDRLSFAHNNKNRPCWKNVLWSDETKINLFGSDGKQFVRRPVNMPLHPKYTKKTIKFGGGNIMVWGCFSYYGVGPIHLVEDIMREEDYCNIIQNVMLPYAEEEMPLEWVFQHDNDPKHASKLVKKCLQDNNVNVMVWPAQSPDLNPIENLWSALKKLLPKEKITNKKMLWEEVQKAWKKIPRELCQKLVLSMKARCDAVMQNKGQTTKY